MVALGSAQLDRVGEGPGPGTADDGDGEGAPGDGGVLVVGDVDVAGEPLVVVAVGEPLVVVPLGVVDSVGVVVSVVVGVVVVVVLGGSCTFVFGAQV